MNGFSCAIIGQGKLTINCADLLLAAGNSICGIVTASAEVRDWAKQKNIPSITPSDNQTDFLTQFDFDFLFSIINPNKVNADILRLPKRAAINFHDAPLPRYAGLHVTSWALINQENAFGVTWHKMSEEFDAGEILKQVEFPIDDDETAFSLNVKCFQHGETQFESLIAELAQGDISGVAQDLNLRSSFLSTKRPDAAGIIDWNLSSEVLEATVRALSYQPDANPIGSAKFLFADQYYLLLEASVLSDVSSAEAGVIQSISNDGIAVSTGTSQLLIKSLSSLDGTPVEVNSLVSECGLKVGGQLTQFDTAQRQLIHDLDHRCGKSEKFWLKRLETLTPYALAQELSNPESKIDNQTIAASFDQSLAAQLQEKLQLDLSDQASGSQTNINLLCALFACFLMRTIDNAGSDDAVQSFDLGVDANAELAASPLLQGLFASRLPLRVAVDQQATVKAGLQAVINSLTEVNRKGGYIRDLPARAITAVSTVLPVAVAATGTNTADPQADVLTLLVSDSDEKIQWRFNAASLSAESAAQIDRSFAVFLQQVLANADQKLADIAVIDKQEQQQLLVDWNKTDKDFDAQQCIHQLFESNAVQRANEIALSFRGDEITYAELDNRANQVANELQQLGAKPDTRIGLFVGRSIEMIIGLLGILKSGAAYVPLDPAYPRDRVALMIEDANAPILVTVTKLADELPTNTAQVVCLDEVINDEAAAATAVSSGVSSDNLAYVIYTSGSTGKPKGVMVEHRNVINFFAGMDDTLSYDGKPGVWLAVTSISFDISVLEIFWSLSRGFKVVIQEEDARTLAQDAVSTVARKMDIGLFYFSSDAGPSESGPKDRYKLLLEGAKYADNHDFSTVWTPERHFHLFGGLYPNPSVTSAAIAAVTSKVAIRAGSIVLPLHNPVRVVEEWSVVDNISNGRVGFSFASGWHANDFSLLPENFPNRKQLMYDNIEVVRKLWSGESVTMKNGEGNDFTARVYPEPVQKTPPMWITTAGNPDSFRAAGEGGFNVLTNLLGQSIDDIKEKIAAYRAGRKAKGHAGEGNVSVMVHTFVGDDVEKVREIVREPFCEYLKTSFDLVKIAPWAFPAFRQPSKSAAQDDSFDAGSLTDEDLDALLEHAFDRYFETAGIFGTPASCIPLIDDLKRAGVDEVACLVDFGVDDELVLDSLQHLNALRLLANPGNLLDAADDQGDEDYSVAAQMRRHQVTHFQCTPSMARILSSDPDTLHAWRGVEKTLLGGEALPADLAATLASNCTGEIVNVYGPTETTIWSSSSKLTDAQDITIGRPIANTCIYILDQNQQPTPIGVAGELYIGGAGVVRGYLDRPELTAERFIDNPFKHPISPRIYRTGDLVKYRNSGDIEYLGRLDHQVKLRGYRIELGEIESLICANNTVNDCVVVAPISDEGTQSLLAYVVPVVAQTDEQKDADADNKVLSEQSVSSWQTIWDETYQSGTGAAESAADDASNIDPTFNFTGWLDSYTGEPHAEASMREWLDFTASRILDLKPRRVLELGCGTGMVLYQVAPHCERYVGVDLSPHALHLIDQHSQSLGWNNVRLLQGAADSDAVHDALKADEQTFDLLVINSVAQYFPSADYLAEVIKRAVEVLTPNGQIFIGDVRCLALMEAFHHSTEMAKAPATMSLADLQARIDEKAEKESELLIAPEFFYALQQSLSGIANVNIQLKRGQYHNEMSGYRYDVTITLGDSTASLTDQDFESIASVASIAEVQNCFDNQSKPFVIRDLVNPRLSKHVYARKQMSDGVGSAQTVADFSESLSTFNQSGVDPEQIYQLNSQWRTELVWAKSGEQDRYDAYFVPANDATAINLAPENLPGDLRDYCFQPLTSVDSFALIDQLRTALGEQLPAFMVPDTFIMLDALPLTPNGKIDRNSLPTPEKRQRQVEEEFVAPESDVEQTIASVLQEMLNLEKIGTKDNFFNMGANSLLIVQANNRLSQRLERKVSLVSMYRYPTIASLADYLSGASDQKQSSEEGQKRGEKRKAAQASRRRRAAGRRK